MTIVAGTSKVIKTETPVPSCLPLKKIRLLDFKICELWHMNEQRDTHTQTQTVKTSGKKGGHTSILQSYWKEMAGFC